MELFDEEEMDETEGSDKYKDCLVVELARVIAEGIEEKDGDPSVMSYNHDFAAIAKIRHACTNYEELLRTLSDAAYDENGYPFHIVCYWRKICTWEDSIEECPGQREAYEIIKSAADELAEKLLPYWRERAPK